MVEEKKKVTRSEINRRLDAYTQFESPIDWPQIRRELTPDEERQVKSMRVDRENMLFDAEEGGGEIRKAQIKEVQDELDRMAADRRAKKVITGIKGWWIVLPIGLVIIIGMGYLIAGRGDAT